jgi:hypothetical protein
MALNPEQRSILNAIYRRANRVSDPGKRARYTRAAVETGLVESGLRNLPGGDADSQGWRQERASLYANPRNVGASVNRFFDELAQVDKGQPSYELAALVQRPAAQYRGRYRDVADQAAQILKGAGGSRGASTPGTPGTTITDTHLAFDPAAQQAAQALKLPERTRPQVTAPSAPTFAAKAITPTGYQAPEAPASSPAKAARFDAGQALEALQTLTNSGGTKTVKTTATIGGKPPGGGGGGAAVPKAGKGAASFEGRPVAKWIKPILEYARERGWKGQINSGVRSYADQQRIYNSGVRPAARPGTSNHEFTAFPGGAVDVSDAQSLSAILKRSKYAKTLVYAGAKDPVHFSHPHGGSY